MYEMKINVNEDYLQFRLAKCFARFVSINNMAKRQLTLFNTFAPARIMYREETNDYHKFVNAYVEICENNISMDELKVEADKQWKEVRGL